MTAPIHVVVRGGLGNQMFQAAYGMFLGQRHGAPVAYIDATRVGRQPRTWELDCFGLLPRMSLSRRTATIIDLAIHCIGSVAPDRVVLEDGPPRPFGTKPWIVSGYWQNLRYVLAAEQMVREAYALPRGGQPRTGRVRTVAIHARRGDYISDPKARALHHVCDEDWYRRAWDSLRARVGHCHGFVFSDDEAWASDHLALPDATVMPKSTGPAWTDLASMSSCRHYIISNSTYSWWAAFLGQESDSTVICPRWWFRDTLTTSLNLCPTNWIMM